MKWLTVKAAIDASGPEGITQPALSAQTGVVEASLSGMVSKIRITSGQNYGLRYVNGQRTYFRPEFRPDRTPQKKRTKMPERIRALVVAAGADGVPRDDMLKVVSAATFKRFKPGLTKAGLLFTVGCGTGRCDSRYFADEASAKAFAAEYKAEALEKRREHDARRQDRRRGVLKAKPAKKKATPPKPIVFARPKQVTVPVKAAVIVNPHNVQPVVLPTPQPRFHVDTVGRHVSANECRPWAMYA